MKISVITVCKNAKDTIEQTLLSLFSQSYKNWELILIDGSSDDGTIEIVKKHESKIHYFVSEPDSGIYNAMNKGLKHVSGDFVFFLNANDTLYSSDVLEKVTDELIAHPDIRLLFGNINTVSPDKLTSKIISYETLKDGSYFMNNNICHQSIFYEKKLFEQIGLYEESYKIASDLDFNIKCLLTHKVKTKYLPITIANFQLGGLSSNLKTEQLMRDENNKIKNIHFKEEAFFIKLDKLCKRYMGPLYKSTANLPVIKKILKNHRKFKLNF